MRSFRRDVRNKKIKILSDDWPHLLYDMDEFVPGQFKPGLLMNKELLNVSQSFTSYPTLASLRADGQARVHGQDLHQGEQTVHGQGQGPAFHRQEVWIEARAPDAPQHRLRGGPRKLLRSPSSHVW